MKLIAVDPGVTTGYCIAGLVDGKLQHQSIQEVDDVADCWDRIASFKPRYIICEDFEFRQRTRSGLVLFSVQLIGVLNLYALKAQHQTALVMQKAATGKSYYTDALLKSNDFYERGKPHAMDATRHLLHWLTFGSGYQYIEGKQLKDLL